jgi:hypothetical protein
MPVGMEKEVMQGVFLAEKRPFLIKLDISE